MSSEGLGEIFEGDFADTTQVDLGPLSQNISQSGKLILAEKMCLHMTE